VVVDSASGADWNEGPPLCALNLGPINFGEDDYKLWVVAASPGFECVA
jgi:hypothetical protein